MALFHKEGTSHRRAHTLLCRKPKYTSLLGTFVLLKTTQHLVNWHRAILTDGLTCRQPRDYV